MLKRVLIVAAGALAIVIVGFAVLVFSSMSYDRNNPRDRPNSYISEVTTQVEQPIEVVFDFVQRGIPAIYTQMSPMHTRFDILNGEMLVVGAEVDAVEGDPDQIIRHRYVVTDVRAPELLVMESEGSEILDRATGDFMAAVDVRVYYDLAPLEDDTTEMTLTVVTDMKNPFLKSMMDVMGYVSGNRDLWQQQFVDELENLAKFAERHQIAEG